MLEGPDLVRAGLAQHAEFEAIYLDASSHGDSGLNDIVRGADAAGVRIYSLARGVLEKVSDAKTPQPVMAVVRMPYSELNDVDTTGVVMVLHDVRDPGNAGTIIRSADAAGVSAVFFTGNSVDPFNPKTLRSTAGSIFHLSVVVTSLDEAFELFARSSVQTVALVVRGGEKYHALDYRGPTALLVGNEATGLDERTVARCQVRASIPMRGRNESLNAATAASLVMFETLRQREDTAVTTQARSLGES